jgi:uncharacterized membrane protein
MSSRTFADAGVRNYAVVTLAYWADTLADGAIRTLVLFYFSQRGYSALQVALHLGFTLAAGKAAGYTRAELLLASNACVGGPTTAAGMATTKGWHQLLVPAILMGVTGYAVATFASIALGQAVLAPLWAARVGA